MKLTKKKKTLTPWINWCIIQVIAESHKEGFWGPRIGELLFRPLLYGSRQLKQMDRKSSLFSIMCQHDVALKFRVLEVALQEQCVKLTMNVQLSRSLERLALVLWKLRKLELIPKILKVMNKHSLAVCMKSDLCALLTVKC